ncbi:hypothetical protein [Mycobacterium montefiorense]|uniref:Uncharacterized protein n=1 Tax=Mycobacterium montefiorense TaxID=154654 RepID=A0ABQ0NML5_9MYCO|nr:hypothetical protein [Mycobacterium montefiorense]GBG38138.1 hypothetical protein MmonteBS_25100 [Mycobacterium montefiorense]GKU33711.1 hypothetical protein NJB14191_10580 [Mycobacterium montefiorense]GKU39483.1 hypothetical protein NJB14192_14760 [Mycobacterium montefiorense]GKU44528.1 hypothetical protein NJB14194_11550 [Mycobacterium montefiorense]GKU51657.1 hypothetical protein NJB14195_29030 [Mycobacterium montefiorense]
MSGDGLFGGPGGFGGGFGFGGFGGPGFGGGPGGFGGWGKHGWGHGGPGGPGFGGGFGPGGRPPLKRAAFVTAALLLDGPADAAQVVQRVSDATDGAVTPPQDIAELAIGLLAGRGVVTVDNGVATLTELGNNLLAWRGISSETAHAFLKRAGQFGDVFKIRRELFEIAGLARTITWTGTDEQKQQLAEARTRVLEALREAKKALHRVLGQD